MFSFWYIVLIAVTWSGPYTGTLADVHEGALSLDLNPGDDAEISPRRQRLIDLLTDLIEKHVPLGVWTRADAPDASRAKDGTSTSNVYTSRSKNAEQNSHRRDSRRKVIIKTPKGERIEVKDDTNRRPPLRYIPPRSNEDEGYHYDNFEPTFDHAARTPTHPSCTTTPHATNLIQSWKREMKENQETCTTAFDDSINYTEFDDEPYSSNYRPEPPQWSTSMILRGELSVPMACYNETYTLWYDADSGESRLEMNGGMTTALRLRTSNGLYKLVGIQYTAEPDGSMRRVCRVADMVALSIAETAPSALPDMSQFTFHGYLKYEKRGRAGRNRNNNPIEHWQYVRSQRVFGSETACEEELTYRHDIFIERRQDGAIPHRYSVEIDSSLLGKVSDTYVHTYQQVDLVVPSSDKFYFDERIECEQVEEVDANDPEQYATYFDPLQEFTSLTRSSMYTEGTLFNRYKENFSKKYNDRAEEVLRSNVLMQETRFVYAVNRRGESYVLEVNYFADMLLVEKIEQFLGSIPDPHGDPIAPPKIFPYTQSEVTKRAKSLPRKFDWRANGWKTPVYKQDPCNTCWAYAVVGAIEGGVFARTNRNLDLSEQCVIDCGHATGARNCNSTWPFYAYEYCRLYGLPEAKRYGPTIAKVGACKHDEVPPVVHISGHVNITVQKASAVKVSIYENGPVVVLVDAKSKFWFDYKHGILNDPVCKNGHSDTNHAVLAVGWGSTDKGQNYFIVKNSWGRDWGQKGYFHIRTNNACGILTQASYPLFPTQVS